MSNFRADCDRCCGLCCVVPDLLAVQGFRVDKPAETPCAHLNELHRCSIHGTRQVQGYTACGGFDCYGAGQWVTQSLFKGAHWTDSPDVARQMFAAYRYWVPRFEAAALLEAALPHVRDDARDTLMAAMRALTCVEAAGDLRAVGQAPGQLRLQTLATIRSALRNYPAAHGRSQVGNRGEDVT
jgi:hypothetical protein